MAEKILKQTHFECVIMDINLPHKNGYDLCKQFRTYNQSTPVIMLTAFDEVDDKVEGFNCGADDYLTKPFYFKELLARVKAHIKKSQANPSGIAEKPIVITDLVIDTHTKTVHRAGVKIDLTAREYQILLALAVAGGNSVSKQELIKKIWGSAFDVNTNTIEVFINLLRNKIDKNAAQKLIKTRVGFGYYIDSDEA
ncbi:MAG: response regulator transcription factor, partial [Bacteroidetes bacterium]|nr:response regulator transcription factor [Bacteroidota bacterium]